MILNSDAAQIPLASNSVDLICTSPPYANMRKHLYGGVHPDDYVAWFKPIAAELMRVLKPRGSFVLNIKENAYNGELRVYVLELILSMRTWGWIWKEEYIWHKMSVYPCSFPDRFPNAWERLLHFTIQRDINFYKDAVKIPRTLKPSMRHGTNGNAYNSFQVDPRDFTDSNNSANGNTHSWNKRLEWAKRAKGLKYPRNVLTYGHAADVAMSWHPAVFPRQIPEFFINLFTVERDVVLDPFVGSGTTVIQAERMARRGIGLEIKLEYANKAGSTVNRLPTRLL